LGICKTQQQNTSRAYRASRLAKPCDSFQLRPDCTRALRCRIWLAAVALPLPLPLLVRQKLPDQLSSCCEDHGSEATGELQIVSPF
jgi:hypothetical protein